MAGKLKVIEVEDKCRLEAEYNQWAEQVERETPGLRMVVEGSSLAVSVEPDEVTWYTLCVFYRLDSVPAVTGPRA